MGASAAHKTQNLEQLDEVTGAFHGRYHLLPGLMEGFQQVRAALAGQLPARLVELVRIRIAYHNQCRACMAARYTPDEVDEALVCELEVPELGEQLSDAERAALRYADLFATNHLAIGEDIYDELREHLTEPQVIALGVHCAMCVGKGRLAATWRAIYDDLLPESFKSDSEELVTPWGHETVLTQPRS